MHHAGDIAARKVMRLEFVGVEFQPGLVLSIIDETIVEGGTLRQRIRMSCSRLILTPDTNAENHSPTGMK